MKHILIAVLFTISNQMAWSNDREAQLDKIVRLSAELTQLQENLSEAKSDLNWHRGTLVVSTALALGLGWLGNKVGNSSGGGDGSAGIKIAGQLTAYTGAIALVPVAGWSGYRVFIKDPRVISQLTEDVKNKLAELNEAKKMELLIQEAN